MAEILSKCGTTTISSTAFPQPQIWGWIWLKRHHISDSNGLICWGCRKESRSWANFDSILLSRGSLQSWRAEWGEKQRRAGGKGARRGAYRRSRRSGNRPTAGKHDGQVKRLKRPAAQESLTLKQKERDGESCASGGYHTRHKTGSLNRNHAAQSASSACLTFWLLSLRWSRLLGGPPPPLLPCLQSLLSCWPLSSSLVWSHEGVNPLGIAAMESFIAKVQVVSETCGYNIAK